MKSVVAILLLLTLGWTLPALSADADSVVIPLTPDQEYRYGRLQEMLKCPVCKNQSIASSESFLSKEMKRLLRERIAAGESDEVILAYFESRYGEWILLAPPKRGRNLVVYLLPGLGAAAIGVGIFVWLRRSKKREAERGVATGEVAAGEWNSAARDLVEKELNT